MADSPTTSAGAGPVSLTLLSDGAKITEVYQAISVDVFKRANKLPAATIVLADGDMPKNDFPLSSSDFFAPGKSIEIKAGYGSMSESIFTGVVVKHSVRAGHDNAGQLVVECRDKAVKMTIGRKNAHFPELKDSDIIAKLVKNGGATPDVAETTVTHPEIVQYYCTDWDFMLTRAEANGLLVIVDAGKVSVKAPDTSGAAVLKVTYGMDLMEGFEFEIDARTQLTEVNAVAWDPVTQALLESVATPPTLNEQGNLTSAKLAEVASPKSYVLQTGAPFDAASLKAWAAARQVKAGLARIRGRMSFQGSGKAAVGKIIELEGVSKRFDGDVFVGAVHHRINADGWITEVEFGLPDEWFAETANVTAPPASGWVPGIEGLHVGVVKKLDANPKGEPMVQVSLPVLKATTGIWARVARFYASDGVGAFFIPEVDDEVVLGFLANDPSFPVVLGSLHSSKRKPPYDLTAKNYTKGFVTKTKLTLAFDDEKKVVTVETPGGNKVVLSDEGKSVTLTDQNGNNVKLDAAGIELKSAKDVKITATGKVTIEGADKISIASKADVAIEGANVNADGKVGFVAKGGTKAEVSSGGQTVVKGAMVMIN